MKTYPRIAGFCHFATVKTYPHYGENVSEVIGSPVVVPVVLCPVVGEVGGVDLKRTARRIEPGCGLTAYNAATP